MVPTILFCVLVLCIWIHYESKKSSNAEKKDSENFWEHEHNADFVRKKDISNLDYVKIPMETLPFGAASKASISSGQPDTLDRISSYEQTIRELSEKKILNLTGITNTELKLSYGTSNLDELSSYDQNFTVLVRTLYQWADSLYSLGFEDEARTLLEFGISCHTDVSGNYILLARMYRKEGNVAALTKLKEEAEKLNTLTKNSILEKIQMELNMVC